MGKADSKNEFIKEIPNRPPIRSRGENGIPLDRNNIPDRIKKITSDLEKIYENTGVTLVCILNGAMPFATDVLRGFVKTNVCLEFVKARSYIREKRGDIELHENLINEDEIKDRHVLILDDIYDSGATLTKVVNFIRKFNPKEIKVFTLLLKTGKADLTISDRVHPDYYCFEIDDVFAVGYGLDYNGRYRNLRHITDYPY